MSPRERIYGVMREIAEMHGFTLALLMSPQIAPQKLMSHARRDVWRYLRAEGWSLPKIARLFARDHTTILYGVMTDEERDRRAGRQKASRSQLIERRRLPAFTDCGNKSSASGRAP